MESIQQNEVGESSQDKYHRHELTVHAINNTAVPDRIIPRLLHWRSTLSYLLCLILIHYHTRRISTYS